MLPEHAEIIQGDAADQTHDCHDQVQYGTDTVILLFDKVADQQHNGCQKQGGGLAEQDFLHIHHGDCLSFSHMLRRGAGVFTMIIP